MSKQRNKEHELEQQRTGHEGDTKMSDRNLSKTKKIKQRATADSSSSSDSSNESKKSNHSSLSPNRKQRTAGKRQRDSSQSQEKRHKQLTHPSEDVHEQRSKWDSPERSNSHRNSTRQRRNTRSRSRSVARENGIGIVSETKSGTITCNPARSAGSVRLLCGIVQGAANAKIGSVIASGGLLKGARFGRFS